MADDDDVYVPLQHQRAFGSGLKRKRVEFVRESVTSASDATARPAISGRAVEDMYLSIVMPRTQPTPPPDTISTVHNLEQSTPDGANAAEPSHDDTAATVKIMSCPICHHQIRADDDAVSHEASLAHQVCLQHSHPPSAIDRQRKGLTYLENQGWDPDGRQGLGARGDGRLYPIQPKLKHDNSGVGARARPKVTTQKPKSLNAGDLQKQEQEDRKRHRRLQRIFHGDEEVNRHLGLEL